MELDKKALGRTAKRPKINDEIWRFQIALRKCEYYHNCAHSKLSRLFCLFWRMVKHHLGMKCGFSSPINVCGAGLVIANYGTIVISQYASIGENCRIHVGVNIGADARHPKAAPKIGSRVYIAPGAKLFGDITIAGYQPPRRRRHPEVIALFAAMAKKGYSLDAYSIFF